MDYARFLQMLLDGGRAGDKQLLGPKTIAMMTSDHIGAGREHRVGLSAGRRLWLRPRLLGAQGDRPVAASRHRRRLCLGRRRRHGFWVDPKENMFVVFMMQAPKNRVYYRVLLRDMIYAAMTK